MKIFAAVTVLSAFLLFLVQPIIAKQILPWFGGAALVWSTALVFFQCALLAGYCYSHWLVRRPNLRRQMVVHFVLLAIAVLLLPIVPDADLKPRGAQQPSLHVLWLLAATIGLPYVLLATTSPLVQSWLVHTHPEANPYRLFALSNLASMVALLAYPLLIEPWLTTRTQALLWSGGFVLFVLLMALSAHRAVRADRLLIAHTQSTARAIPPPTVSDRWVWMALAALGSSFLLGVSNQLTHNVASVPLLWVVPLAIYLLTFILSFSAQGITLRWYPYWLSLPLTGAALCVMAWLLADRRFEFDWFVQIGVFASGLFIACMYCHGELAARRPHPDHLTTYYLMIAIGGALGSLLVGIVAPLTLPAYYELGLTIYATALLATWLLRRRLHGAWVAVGGAVAVFTLGASIYTMIDMRADVIAMMRNFYGVVRVKEVTFEDGARKRSLVHGGILHGEQYLDGVSRYAATTYYTNSSGVGLALVEKANALDRPLRVGVIGLGVGTLAVYGQRGDRFRFYELNPAVVDVARRYFTYLQDSLATIEIALGDARLNLEREPPQNFDVLAIDAFSSDAIPVHLITLEALTIYERHMQPDGIIAFHVSNRFLELHPIVKRLAEARGMQVAWIDEVRADGGTTSDWILLSKDARVLAADAFANVAIDIPARPEWRLWTDDYNNIMQVLR